MVIVALVTSLLIIIFRITFFIEFDVEISVDKVGEYARFLGSKVVFKFSDVLGSVVI